MASPADLGSPDRAISPGGAGPGRPWRELLPGGRVWRDIDLELADHEACLRRHLVAAGLDGKALDAELVRRFGRRQRLLVRLRLGDVGKELLMKSAFVLFVFGFAAATAGLTWKCLEAHRALTAELSAVRERLGAANHPDSLATLEKLRSLLVAGENGARGVRVSGRLFWGSPDQPMTGCELALVRVDGGYGGGAVNVGADGGFEFPGVRPGDYRLTFRAAFDESGRYAGDGHNPTMRPASVFHEMGKPFAVGTEDIDATWNPAIRLIPVKLRWTDRARKVLAAMPNLAAMDFGSQNHDPKRLNESRTGYFGLEREDEVTREESERTILVSDALPRAYLYANAVSMRDRHRRLRRSVGFIELKKDDLPTHLTGDVALPEGMSPEDYWNRFLSNPFSEANALKMSFTPSKAP
jgi:hypothetical protein